MVLAKLICFYRLPLAAELFPVDAAFAPVVQPILEAPSSRIDDSTVHSLLVMAARRGIAVIDDGLKYSLVSEMMVINSPPLKIMCPGVSGLLSM